MTLAFSKYEFELSSLKPILNNLKNAEKVLNKILFLTEKAEDKVKDLNLAEIFKKDLKFLDTYSQENFVPLLIYLNDFAKKASEPYKEEILNFIKRFAQNFEKFQKFIKDIIEKTPEIIGPSEKFEELNRKKIPIIYDLFEELDIIFKKVMPEIDEKLMDLFIAEISPNNEITDRRRETKKEFKSFMQETEKNIKNINESTETQSQKQPKILTETSLIDEKKEWLSKISKNLENFIEIATKQEFTIQIDSLDTFRKKFEDLKNLTNESDKLVREINIFLDEMNFGVIFQEDLDLLNDIFYDYFNPFLNSFRALSEKYEGPNSEEFKEFTDIVQDSIIRIQNKLNEVIEFSTEPLKRIEIDSEIFLNFAQMRTNFKKISLKTKHLAAEVKNIYLYIQGIALIRSDKYSKELKQMINELLDLKKQLGVMKQSKPSKKTKESKKPKKSKKSKGSKQSKRKKAKKKNR